ncbi:MAG: hypothetical protein ACLQVY_14695 [Limisphaerales bacterium]
MKTLKTLSLAALALMAVTTATTAASTITNVIQDISIAFTIYPSNTTVVSHGGALLTSTVKQASLGTGAVLAALRQATGASFNPNTAKLVLLTQYTDTNVYTYTVNYVLNDHTNLQQAQVSSTETYDSFTNDAAGYLYYNLGLTNTYVESVNTNFSTAVVLTNLSTTPIYAVDDNGALTLLTNLAPYAPFSSSSAYDQTTLNAGTSTTNYYPVFGDYNQFDTNDNALTGGSPDIGLYNASNDWFFSGTTFAVDGAAIFGTSRGTTYALESDGGSFYGPYGSGTGGYSGLYFALNSPADWVFNAFLAGPATVATKTLGPAKDAVPINYITGTFSAAGTGWMGGTKSSSIYTNSSLETTNVWVTNAIPFVLKGTVSLGPPTVKAAAE